MTHAYAQRLGLGASDRKVLQELSDGTDSTFLFIPSSPSATVVPLDARKIKTDERVRVSTRITVECTQEQQREEKHKNLKEQRSPVCARRYLCARRCATQKQMIFNTAADGLRRVEAHLGKICKHAIRDMRPQGVSSVAGDRGRDLEAPPPKRSVARALHDGLVVHQLGQLASQDHGVGRGRCFTGCIVEAKYLAPRDELVGVQQLLQSHLDSDTRSCQARRCC